MNGTSIADTRSADASWPKPGVMTCDACRTRLADFIRRLLAGSTEEDTNVEQHLEGCPSCSQTFIDLIDLMTSNQVRALQVAMLGPDMVSDIALDAPSRALQSPVHLAQLLRLWQMQLSSCNRLQDVRGAAFGLSIIGMIHRRMGQEADKEATAAAKSRAEQEYDEAKLVHDLALATAEESGNLLSAVVSNADLGHITRREGNTGIALEHLQVALRESRRIADSDSEARLNVMIGDLQMESRFWTNAVSNYEQARELAHRAGDLFIEVLARFRRVSAILGERRHLQVGAVTGTPAPAPDEMEVTDQDVAEHEGQIVARLLDGPHITSKGVLIVSLRLPEERWGDLEDRHVSVRWGDQELATTSVERGYVVVRAALPATLLPANWSEVGGPLPIPANEVSVVIEQTSGDDSTP